MKCSMCENKKILRPKLLKKYRYKESGLDNIILCGIKENSCDKCGEKYYSFGNIDKLHALIAKILIQKRDTLTGKEVRFLRKHLGYSGTVFSKLIGYEVEHLSRLENGKTPIQETFDRLVRFLILEKMPDRDYDLQDLFLEGKLMKIEWLELSNSSKKGWELKKAS